jgi:hypothetical protein
MQIKVKDQYVILKAKKVPNFDVNLSTCKDVMALWHQASAHGSNIVFITQTFCFACCDYHFTQCDNIFIYLIKGTNNVAPKACGGNYYMVLNVALKGIIKRWFAQ